MMMIQVKLLLMCIEHWHCHWHRHYHCVFYVARLCSVRFILCNTSTSDTDDWFK